MKKLRGFDLFAYEFECIQIFIKSLQIQVTKIFMPAIRISLYMNFPRYRSGLVIVTARCTHILVLVTFFLSPKIIMYILSSLQSQFTIVTVTYFMMIRQAVAIDYPFAYSHITKVINLVKEPFESNCRFNCYEFIVNTGGL